MTVYLIPDQSHHFWDNIIAHNIYAITPSKSHCTFVSDSGANHHMYHDKVLFITISPYSGTNPDVTLGKDFSTTPIQKIITIELRLKDKQFSYIMSRMSLV